MNKKGVLVKDANILILGITFKENCPDIRNTKVVDIYNTLKEYTPNITVYDPWANPDKVTAEYGISITSSLSSLTPHCYDAVILAVSHDAFKTLDIQNLVKGNGVIYDVKGVLPRDIIDSRL